MFVFLVHHAEAVGPDVDPQRPLSARGFAQAAALADQAKARLVKPAAIWHSGKLRGRQTAEAFYRACNPFADFRMVRGIRPEDSVAHITVELNADDRDVLLVGHMPHLPTLARRLCDGVRDFPMNGMVALERAGDGVYVECWRAVPKITG
jgi:phosphohistidine phosphatase